MQFIIQEIERRCDEQVQKADHLLKSLEQFGWKDIGPTRTKAKREKKWESPDFEETVEVPASTRIPAKFIHTYHEWYSASVALVEGNMPSRSSEMVALHEGLRGAKQSPMPMMQLLQLQLMTFDQQLMIASRLTHMKSLVASIPTYMKARLHDVELAVAQSYVRDELSEAEILLKARFIRAAGAIAGVLLERHLKLLCDRHNPPISYSKSTAISPLNDLLRDRGVYDVAQWRRVQWMGDVRNSCDHARTTEPQEEIVEDLIREVRKFVSLFVL